MDKNRLQANYIRNLLRPLRYLTQLKTKFNLGSGQIICENLIMKDCSVKALIDGLKYTNRSKIENAFIKILSWQLCCFPIV